MFVIEEVRSRLPKRKKAKEKGGEKASNQARKIQECYLPRKKEKQASE